MRKSVLKSPPIVEVQVDSASWRIHRQAHTSVIRKAIRAAIAGVKLPRFLACDKLEVSVLLTGDRKIRILNRDYRGKDRPTNVLSFPQSNDEDMPAGMPTCHLGDIVLAYGTIAREARLQGKSFRHHLMHLSVHGTLHLLGYDHENDRDAKQMENLEIQILKGLKIENPYQDAEFMV